MTPPARDPQRAGAVTRQLSVTRRSRGNGRPPKQVISRDGQTPSHPSLGPSLSLQVLLRERWGCR